MGVQGARKGSIRALAVATDISPPASPCGMCRQFIREFCEVCVTELIVGGHRECGMADEGMF